MVTLTWLCLLQHAPNMSAPVNNEFPLPNYGGPGPDIIKMGYLKKLKTMRKKYFVLRSETPRGTSRLEYYDDEKKFRKYMMPKRMVILKTCFNINRHRRHDIKPKHVIDLYTKDDCFSVIYDTEAELEEWLKPMLFLQHGEEYLDGEPPKPIFDFDIEHIWQVKVMEKGLGGHRNIQGNYRLCLTEKTLSLVPDPFSAHDTLEFSLIGIRRCGFSDTFFYIEVGRSSVTGAGDIFMNTEDINITRNMHDIILQAMGNSNKDDVVPKQRSRSSSATESSKPSTILNRRQTLASKISEAPCTNGSAAGRERCDSLPSRARTTSESQMSRTAAHHLRPRSMYGHDGPASPQSACSTDSAGSSMSIDETEWAAEVAANEGISVRYGHSLTPEEPVIFEENDEWDRPTIPKNSPNMSSGIHSESPSGASCGSSPRDNNSEYVIMGRGDTGYVDMRMSPAASNCSITSGTPSTDMRFSEYHLDKVSSYIPIDDEDSGRPLRTYSVGSKPQRSEYPKLTDNIRTRAFSVGSHNKSGPRRNLKASSAPAPLVAGSPMGDLMEMDFSENRPYKPSDYVEMKSVGSEAPSDYVDMRPGSSIKEVAPYVEMGGPLSTSPVKPVINYMPYVDMSGSNKQLGTSPKTYKSSSPKQDGYMIMTPRQLSVENKKISEGYVEMTRKYPRKPTTSTSSNNSDDYVIMTGQTNGKNKSNQRKEKVRSKPIAIQTAKSCASPKIGPPSYLPLQNTSVSSPSSSPYSSLQRNKNRKTPDTPTPTGSIFSISLSSPRLSARAAFLNSNLNSNAEHNHRVNNAHTGMTCSNNDIYTNINVNNTDSDYMMFNPTSTQSQPLVNNASNDDDCREYAIMKPAMSRRIMSPAAQKSTSLEYPTTSRSIFSRQSLPKSSTSNQVQIVKQGAVITNLPQSSFKPITANLSKLDDDSNKPKSVSPKTVDNLLTKQLSGLSIDKKQPDVLKSSESLPLKDSRPNSVNSEKISAAVRPSSVNSEKFTTNRPSSVSSESSLSKSRPSSSSSDLNSSSSTLVGSRPPSVSSERELHYITLNHDEGKNFRAPKTPNFPLTPDTSGSPSPGSNSQSEPKFSYSSIDFIATDELKQNASSAASVVQNAKVKH